MSDAYVKKCEQEAGQVIAVPWACRLTGWSTEKAACCWAPTLCRLPAGAIEVRPCFTFPRQPAGMPSGAAQHNARHHQSDPRQDHPAGSSSDTHQTDGALLGHSWRLEGINWVTQHV